VLFAVTRAPPPTIVDCELTYLERVPIDFAGALAQHRAYCERLELLGTRVLVLPADERYPDSSFVEDTAVVLDEIIVITCPGAASRRGETELIAPVLAPLRPLERISLPGTLDGGDVVRLGRVLHVGLSGRTNTEGVQALERVCAPHGYRVVPVPFDGCLHLKSGCTALDDETVLLNPAWVDPARFADYQVLTVEEGEPWAADVLPVAGMILMNSSSPRTIERVESQGYRVGAVDISEFMKAEAGVTCLSLLVETPE
jgi:dimethylargininase